MVAQGVMSVWSRQRRRHEDENPCDVSVAETCGF